MFSTKFSNDNAKDLGFKYSILVLKQNIHTKWYFFKDLAQN